MFTISVHAEITLAKVHMLTSHGFHYDMQISFMEYIVMGFPSSLNGLYTNLKNRRGRKCWMNTNCIENQKLWGMSYTLFHHFSQSSMVVSEKKIRWLKPCNISCRRVVHDSCSQVSVTDSLVPHVSAIAVADILHGTMFHVRKSMLDGEICIRLLPPRKKHGLEE